MASFSLTQNRVVNYIKESNTELRKVAWPSRKTVLRHTALVVGAALVMGAFFGALDYGLTIGFEELLKLKQ